MSLVVLFSFPPYGTHACPRAIDDEAFPVIVVRNSHAFFSIKFISHSDMGRGSLGVSCLCVWFHLHGMGVGVYENYVFFFYHVRLFPVPEKSNV